MSVESKRINSDANKTADGTCPICGKPRVKDYRPFCSKRCADVDLGRWLKGDYAIPVMPDDDEDGEDLPIPANSVPHEDKGD